MTRAQQRLIAFLLILLTFLSDAGWLVVDLGARISGTTQPDAPFDAVAFTQAQSIWNVLVFYTHVSCHLAAIILFLTRPGIAWALFSVATLLGLIDWIMLTGNPHLEIGLISYISIGTHVFACIWVAYYSLSR